MAQNPLTFKNRRSPMQNAIIGFGVTIIVFYLIEWIPTQWFAWKYHFDPNLGEPLYRWSHFALYAPSDWIGWGWRLGDVPALRSSVHTLTIIGGISFILALLLGIFVIYKLNKANKGMEDLHGSARWAEVEDVDKTGFIPGKNYKPTGVVIGSVMFDKRKKLIHPHHPRYKERYKEKIDPKTKLVERDEKGRHKFEKNTEVIDEIEILKDGQDTHVFAYCPTRSGKGVGMVIPTLLTLNTSVMVNDPKGEAFGLTAGFRKAAGQNVIKFEPACIDGSGARWNPLSEIRAYTPYDVQDAQMIMSIACDPKGEGLEDYFDKAGYEFLVGVALHMVYAEKNPSLEGVAHFLGDPKWDDDTQMYNAMINAEHDPEGKMGWVDSMRNPTRTHPIIANVAKTMLNKEDKDRSGVLSTAKSLLTLYLDPIVARNTNTSDFLVRDLMTGDKPVTLYFVVGPADMERMTPLTRLFYALFIRRNAAEMAFADGRSTKNYTFPLMMIIDEMPALRKLPILQEGLGYVAGYGIRIFMLAQDIAQVEDIYGNKQTIESGASTRIVYAPNNGETAKKLEDLIGKITVTEEKSSYSKDMLSIKAASVSTSIEKSGRALLTAEEFMTLDDQDAVIFVKGKPPIYARKAFYFENPVLLGRAKMPAPKKSDVLRHPQDAEAVATPKEEEKAATTDRWAASRAALRARQIQNIGSEGGEGNDGIAISPAKSRYVKEEARQISQDEIDQVNAMVNDHRLLDKVARLSAFSE